MENEEREGREGREELADPADPADDEPVTNDPEPSEPEPEPSPEDVLAGTTPIPAMSDEELIDSFDQYMCAIYSSKGSVYNARHLIKKFNCWITDHGEMPISRESVDKYSQSHDFLTLGEGSRRQCSSLLTRLLALQRGEKLPIPTSPGENSEKAPIVARLRKGQLQPSQPKTKAGREPAMSKSQGKTDDATGAQDTAQDITQDTSILGVGSTPIFDNIPDPGGAIVEPMGARARGVSNYPTLPETKKVLGEEARIKVYAVDNTGDQHEAGRYTTKAIEFAGGAAEFVRKYVAPRWRNCEEFRFVVIDAKGGERPYSKVTLPRPSDPAANAVRDTAEMLRAEREEAMRAERERRDYETKREERLATTLERVVGSGGTNNGGIAREMIQMELAKGMLADLRGKDSNYVDALTKRLDDLAKNRDEAVAHGAREPSPLEQMMQIMATKRMMDELFPAKGSGSHDPFELPPMMTQMPPIVQQSPAAAFEGLEKVVDVMHKLAPQQVAPPPPITYDGVLDMMARVNTLMNPNRGKDPTEMIVAMLQSQLARSDAELATLRAEMIANRPQPKSMTEQLGEFATIMSNLKTLNGAMGGGGGGGSAPMGTLEFVDAIFDKVPAMIDSYANAKEKIVLAQLAAGSGSPDNGAQETGGSAASSGSDADAKKKTSRVWVVFAQKIEGAKSDDEYGNALIYLVQNLKAEERWNKLFKGLAMMAIANKRGEVFKVVETILNTMYENNPPEGVIAKITAVIMKNSKQLAAFMGVGPGNSPKEIAGKQGAQGAQPAQPAQPEQPAQPRPPLRVVQRNADEDEAQRIINAESSGSVDGSISMDAEPPQDEDNGNDGENYDDGSQDDSDDSVDVVPTGSDSDPDSMSPADLAAELDPGAIVSAAVDVASQS